MAFSDANYRRTPYLHTVILYVHIVQYNFYLGLISHLEWVVTQIPDFQSLVLKHATVLLF